MSVLGFFDSGLGGLTVLRRVRELLPAHDLVYLADQAHVPYGERTPENLLDLLAHNVRFLNEAAVDAIVMACNTSCAVAAERGWPPSAAPVIDLIESAAIAVRDAGALRVGVVATAATVNSGAYGRAIRRLVPHVEVYEIAAPALVPLVEAGVIAGETPRAAVAAVCAPIAGRVDALVLGCSHYPVLDEHFADALGQRVSRIDPALVQAHRAVAFAHEHGLGPGRGTIRYFTSGDPAAFDRQAAPIAGAAVRSQAIAAIPASTPATAPG